MTWGESLSPEWRRNKPLILARDNYTCQLEWSQCTVRATEVDHIINRDAWPHDEPGRDSMNNGQAVCHRCHVMKTSREQQKKRKENKAKAQHPWANLKHPGLR
ncbi:HNH endonuclease [Gordonia Phage JonJames]|nr:HNH endonuclease [Gordonia Phage JonJames]